MGPFVRQESRVRVGIQILSLRPGQVGGQEVLVRRLVARMLPLLGDDRIVVFHRPELAGQSDWQGVLNHAKLDCVVANPEAHYGGGYAAWAIKVLQDARVDVAFFPLFFFFPRPLPIPLAVHVPDVQHEFYPEYFSAEELAWRRERIPESVALADAVITGSEFSAGTLRERLAADPVRLHVIYTGGFLQEELDAAPLAPGESPGANDRTWEPLDAPFVFYPAADWPHKNHSTLLRAMAILARRGRPVRLVLTGILTRSGDKLRALVDVLGIAGRVHFLGCVDQRSLIGLYRRAALLAFPSRFEGFGLPLVEAMQLGCPVVASRAGAVVETTGDAAVFCDDSPEAWAEALDAVLESPDLQADLRRRGRARAADFDWDAAARRYLALLRGLADR